jgi:hypothetical protein
LALGAAALCRKPAIAMIYSLWNSDRQISPQSDHAAPR